MAIVKWSGSGAGRGLASMAKAVVPKRRPKFGTGVSLWRAKVPSITTLPRKRVPSVRLPSVPSTPSIPSPVKSAGVGLAGAFFDALDRRDARKPVCVGCRAKYPAKGSALCTGCIRSATVAQLGVGHFRRR